MKRSASSPSTTHQPRLRVLFVLALLLSAGVHGIAVGIPYLIGRAQGGKLSPFEVQFSMIKEVVDTQRDRYEEILKEIAGAVGMSGKKVWSTATFGDNVRNIGQMVNLTVKEAQIAPGAPGTGYYAQITLVSPTARAVQDAVAAMVLAGYGSKQLPVAIGEVRITIMEKDGLSKRRLTVPARICRGVYDGKIGLPDALAQVVVS